MVETSGSDVKRVVYFKGHKDQQNSAMICQLFRDYETFSKLFSGESATRTLLNLYNLHAVRGQIDSKGALVFETSMSGPHHYFGWIDPKEYHILQNDAHGNLYYRLTNKEEVSRAPVKILKPVPDDFVLKLSQYTWVKGEDLDETTRATHKIGDELTAHLLDTEAGASDSIFDSPGILLLESPQLSFKILSDPHTFDLSPFNAQIVQNDSPFAFNQKLVQRYEHAQHKLRVVTYNYGHRYFNDYLMNASGAFIERHEFIQAITPLNSQCGGFVVLGREVTASDGNSHLELIACPVPFGFTLLVDVGSIHGDSTLTGLYMMAMTGNHHAMSTADTVYLKHRETRGNVLVQTIPSLPLVQGVSGSELLITSDQKPLHILHQDDHKIKDRIRSTLNSFEALYWQPVIAVFPKMLGWNKTLEKELPKIQGKEH